MKRGNGWLKTFGGALIGAAATLTVLWITRSDRNAETARVEARAGGALAATVDDLERRVTEHDRWADGVYSDYLVEIRKINERLAALDSQVGALSSHLAVVPGRLDKIADKQSEILQRLRERPR